VIDKKTLLYIGLGIVILVLLVFTFFPNMTYAVKNLFIEDNPDDKCSPPAGTNEKEWREHMGHHPDIYAECLS
jgi:hypothetical protein